MPDPDVRVIWCRIRLPRACLEEVCFSVEFCYQSPYKKYPHSKDVNSGIALVIVNLLARFCLMGCIYDDISSFYILWMPAGTLGW